MQNASLDNFLYNIKTELIQLMAIAKTNTIGILWMSHGSVISHSSPFYMPKYNLCFDINLLILLMA